jgi:hypothetical protein
MMAVIMELFPGELLITNYLCKGQNVKQRNLGGEYESLGYRPGLF